MLRTESGCIESIEPPGIGLQKGRLLTLGSYGSNSCCGREPESRQHHSTRLEFGHCGRSDCAALELEFNGEIVVLYTSIKAVASFRKCHAI